MKGAEEINVASQWQGGLQAVRTPSLATCCVSRRDDHAGDATLHKFWQPTRCDYEVDIPVWGEHGVLKVQISLMAVDLKETTICCASLD